MKMWRIVCVIAVIVAFGIALLAEEAKKVEVQMRKSYLLEIGGVLSLDTLWQDADIGDFLYGIKRNFTFTDPTLSLDMKFSIKGQMFSFIQLRTPYYLDDYLGTRPVYVVDDPVTGTIKEYPSRTVELSQLYLEAKEFLSPYTSLRLGVQQVRYQMTHHGAFLLGLGESEDPFAGVVYPNWPVDKATLSKPAVYSNNFSFNAHAAGSVEAGGVLFSIKPKVAPTLVEMQIDLLGFTTLETKHLNQDREILGVVGQIFYPKEVSPQVKAMLALLSFSANANSRIVTFGGGFDWLAAKGIEFYCELYGQTGDFYEGFVRPPPGDPYSVSYTHL
ncbi:MAG: hypothetical protein N2234_09615, partial [Planctomycetota bacterium]|nr:hypothetical protein [Planctomycetota bacterium]